MGSIFNLPHFAERKIHLNDFSESNQSSISNTPLPLGESAQHKNNRAHLNLVVGVPAGGDVHCAEDGREESVPGLEDVSLVLQPGIRVDVSSALQLQLEALRNVLLENRGVGLRRLALPVGLLQLDPGFGILGLPLTDRLRPDAGEDALGGDVVEDVVGNSLESKRKLIVCSGSKSKAGMPRTNKDQGSNSLGSQTVILTVPQELR